MSNAEYKNFDMPDEVRAFEKGKLEILHIGDGVVGKITLEPGWRWSDHVKPIAGTEWCEAPHSQYILSGHMHVTMTDSTEFDVGPGTVVMIPPGHNAWVIGNEPVVVVDWTGLGEYAKK